MRGKGKIQLMAKGGETGERILEATEAAVRAIFIIVAMLACELVIIGGVLCNIWGR